MPFTFAHPAIVLPLKKFFGKWFSMTGLIVGSIAPDFEYFIRMKVSSIYSHTWKGIFYFDLPMALLLAFTFHLIVKNSLINNLPRPIQVRCIGFLDFNWILYFKKNVVIVLISILLGAASHILWDDFTHIHGFFVQKFSFLRNKISINNYKIPIFKILQHGSTLFGLLFIIWYFQQLPRSSTINKMSNDLHYWLKWFIFTLSFFMVWIFMRQPNIQLGDTIVSVISCGMISLIIIPIFNAEMTKNNRKY